jgi:hypothetical protein
MNRSHVVHPSSSPATLAHDDFKSHKSNFTVIPSLVGEAAQTPGRPLDPEVYNVFASRFGYDFSRVRVHADERSAEANRSIGARAYTIGNHIVFGANNYAPDTEAGKRLICHELVHTLQQKGAAVAPFTPFQCGTAGDQWEAEADCYAAGAATESGYSRMVTPLGSGINLQCDNDREALQTRLRRVRARLAQLRGSESSLDSEFSESYSTSVQRRSQEEITRRIRDQARSSSAERSLWGSFVAGNRIRRAASVSQGGQTVTVNLAIQLSYLALSEQEGRQRATIDIPRIESAIRSVWQVDISSGEYAGISFRLQPVVTFLAPGNQRADNAFLIQVRGQDTAPSSGESVTGTISLAPVHLEGSRVIVVAHELAHLFGFVDTYLPMRSTGPDGQPREQWSVGRSDPAGRADVLGLIDPVKLERLERQGSITSQDRTRQSGSVRVWEEEASILLRTLRVAPLPPQRISPDSDDFDPDAELDRTRREGEARLSPIRESRRRAENSLEWLTVVEEIMRLEQEERELVRRLGSVP